MSAGDEIPFHGLLALDKPLGATSHDAVLEVRRRLGSRGAGHLGTLDPAATGLLLVAMGAATRAIAVWQGGEKTYEARVRFGVITASQDLDGPVIESRDTQGLTEARVREAALGLVGDIEQVPPMVSAIQVGGKRLHRLARAGQTIERAARRVRVREWEWLEFALPEAAFRVRCSGGTYVRTLAHDLGQSLGTGAALAALRRTRSEPFSLERSVALADLARLPAAEVLARAGIPLEEALASLPAITLGEAAAFDLGMGRALVVDHGGVRLGAGPRSVVLRAPSGRALALGELEPHGEAGKALACPHLVFPWAVRTGKSGSSRGASAAGSPHLSSAGDAGA